MGGNLQHSSLDALWRQCALQDMRRGGRAVPHQFCDVITVVIHSAYWSDEICDDFEL